MTSTVSQESAPPHDTTFSQGATPSGASAFTSTSAIIPLVPLAKGFRDLTAFQRQSYSLLPFRFLPWDAERYLLTNLAGEYLLLPRSDFHRFVRGALLPDENAFLDLKGRHFLYDATSQVALDLLAAKWRTQQARLPHFTALHIFVVTLRCDHSCPYCQVSRVTQDKTAFDMTPTTAERALDLVFRSPSPVLKIEFQGGESLLNFDLIRLIVEGAKARLEREGASRRLEFVIATNLSPLADDSTKTREILAFCREHGIGISTSLDGPRELHNANRPRPGGDAFERVTRGIERVREALGHEGVAALMTTTVKSLEQPHAIIDEYRRQGFASIFLRPISPFGFAVKSAAKIGYETERFARFYREGLEYIIELNRRGEHLREEYASIVLGKMLSSRPNGYVDLQSPSGLGTAVLVYNYDGDVYASDEGRMLAQNRDFTFRLGNVHRDSYETIIADSPLLPLVHETMAEGTPMCIDCAFLPWCGTDPVYHHATQGDAVGHRPTSGFCQRNMNVFRLLIEMMEADPFVRALFRRWSNR